MQSAGGLDEGTLTCDCIDVCEGMLAELITLNPDFVHLEVIIVSFHRLELLSVCLILS